MTRTILVAPTEPGVGLTAVCLGLVHALRERGVDVGYFKPLAQPRSHGRHDGRTAALIRLVTNLEPPHSISADEVDKALGSNAQEALMERVVGLSEPLHSRHDVVVVEGLVPGAGLVYAGRANVALAKALDAGVLLVSAGRDGRTPEDVAESVAIAAGMFQVGEHPRVAGAFVNLLPDSAPGTVQALRNAVSDRGVELVGSLPYRPELAWPRLRDLMADLEIEVLNRGDLDRRVKDVVIGAQAVPGVLPLLREGLLVIVPGDRHELVLSVCLAAMNGTRMAGLLLPLGARPAPGVWELGKSAMATGLPGLLTPSNSYETATTVHDTDPEIPEDDTERATAVMTAVADALDVDWVRGLPQSTHRARLSPPAFRRRLTVRAREAARRIVLPEGDEPRTLQAATICQRQGIAHCVLLAPPERVATQAAGLGLELPAGLEIVDPTVIDDRYVDALVAARARKGMTVDTARDLLTDPVMLGTIMLHLDEVDGLVAGAVHTTAATLRPALQVIGPAPGSSLVSSVFFMCLPDDVVIYGDCAVNPDPNAEQLADIAIQSADSAVAFGIDPRVAMISFSTGSSGSGADVAKVTEATTIVRARRPDLLVDGPLQYDAAAIESVARSKAPHSPVAGRATVFVFPDLNTGNTTYKAVQRSADVVSIGPLLQGLAKPVNDLSRGALVDDIVYTIALTAIQADQAKKGQASSTGSSSRP